MAQHRVPSGVDPIDFLLRENANLANRVQALEGRRLSTWDRNDYTSVAAPTEGQHHVDASDETVRYYSNGAWRNLGSVPVEWAQLAASNQSLGTSLTALEFASIDGDYNTDLPTFDLSGGDLLIGQEGMYAFTIVSRGWTLAANVVTVLKLEFSKTAGTAGSWSGAAVGASGFASVARLLRFDPSTAPTTDDYSPISNPDLFTLVAWDSNGTFPVTLQGTAFIEEDEAGVAHSEGDFRLFAVRFGSLYGA